MNRRGSPEEASRVRRIRLFYLALLLVLLAVVMVRLAAGTTATSTQTGAPFDPHPLLQQAGPEKNEPYTFAVFGDSYANPALAPLLKMVAEKSPTFVVTMGDMVSNGTDAGTWRTLRERAGWFMQQFSTWPVIGNHELGSARAGAQAFEDFYRVSPGNYSFTFRRSKFIILGHNGTTPEDQIAYLKRELADRDKYQHVFVFRHSPFYTVGSKSRSEVPNTSTAITQLFTQYHVTAVFAGHDHSYYRTKREEVNYITSANAGAGLYPLKRLKEQVPGDAYMSISNNAGWYLLHTPTTDKRVSREKSPVEDWLFAVFIHVDGNKVTGQTISVLGEVWDTFEL